MPKAQKPPSSGANSNNHTNIRNNNSRKDSQNNLDNSGNQMRTDPAQMMNEKVSGTGDIFENMQKGAVDFTRQIQPSRNKTKVHQKFERTQLALHPIVRELANRDLQTGSIKSEYNTITVSIGFDSKRLLNQAQTWAQTIASKPELDLYKTLGMKTYYYERALIKMYLYCYLKAICYGYNLYTSIPFENNSLNLAGFACLYHFMIKRSFSFEFSDDKFLTVNFEMFELSELKTFVDEINAFSDFGNSIYISDKRITCFDGIIEAQLKRLRQLAGPEEFVLLEMQGDPQVTKIFTEECFPFLNSIYTDRKLDNFYYIRSNDQYFTSKNTIFGKACFLYLNGTSIPNISDIYSKSIIKDDDYWLVHYEVSSICNDNYYPFKLVKK